MSKKLVNPLTTEIKYIQKYDQENKTNISLIISIFGFMLALIFLIILTKYILFSIILFFLVGIVLGYLIRSVNLANKIKKVQKAFSRKQQ